MCNKSTYTTSNIEEKGPVILTNKSNIREEHGNRDKPKKAKSIALKDAREAAINRMYAAQTKYLDREESGQARKTRLAANILL